MTTKLTLLALLFALPLMSTDQPKMKRLESLSWNPVTNKLTWTVSEGAKDGTGEYKPDTEQQTYVIDLQQATMEHKGTRRRFSKEEAENVAVVMGLISKYAQESTVWWEAGKGEPVGGREKVELVPSHPPRAIWGAPQSQIADARH